MAVVIARGGETDRQFPWAQDKEGRPGCAKFRVCVLAALSGGTLSIRVAKEGRVISTLPASRYLRRNGMDLRRATPFPTLSPRGARGRDRSVKDRESRRGLSEPLLLARWITPTSTQPPDDFPALLTAAGNLSAGEDKPGMMRE